MSWPWIVRIFACPKLWKQDRWEWTWQVCWLQFRTWLEATKNAVSFCFLKLHPPDRHDTKDRDVMILWHSVRPGSLLAWLSWDILWVWQSLRLDIQDLTLGINIRPQGFLTTADHHQTRSRKASRKSPVQAKDRGGRPQGLQPSPNVKNVAIAILSPKVWNLELFSALQHINHLFPQPNCRGSLQTTD